MGKGNGHGGRRQGAGRKPKDPELRALDGNAGRRGKVLAHPSATNQPAPPPLPVLDEADAPDDLSMDERRIWLTFAPLAIQKGTLTPATEYAFKLLCRHILLENRYAQSVTDAGGANHRGMIARVVAELGDFGLRAFGKSVLEAAAKPAEDPMKDKYFGSSR